MNDAERPTSGNRIVKQVFGDVVGAAQGCGKGGGVGGKQFGHHVGVDAGPRDAVGRAGDRAPT